LRSRSSICPTTESCVEKPAPTEISPVDFSSTSTLMTVLSGALPATLLTSAFLKKPRPWMRWRERCSLAAL